MGSKLIKLADGTLVEVEVNEKEASEISGGIAKRVETSFSEIAPLLTRIC